MYSASTIVQTYFVVVRCFEGHVMRGVDTSYLMQRHGPAFKQHDMDVFKRRWDSFQLLCGGSKPMRIRSCIAITSFCLSARQGCSAKQSSHLKVLERASVCRTPLAKSWRKYKVPSGNVASHIRGSAVDCTQPVTGMPPLTICSTSHISTLFAW
jgi:hypothetical protein